MSGHSKWHNIRVKKMASDSRKGKVYTKYARLIEIAAREGGGDPEKNARLRGLIESAKSESVPNANIERAVKKGTGELKGEAMQELLYEAYGPGGAALLIECLSDNRNRTLSNVKLLLSKHGGRFAESGSVLWMFARKGVVEAGGPVLADPARRDALELRLIDVGAEDIAMEGELVRVVTNPTAWATARDVLVHAGATVTAAGLHYVPTQTVTLDAAALEKMHNLEEALEGDDDIVDVHTNAVGGA